MVDLKALRAQSARRWRWMSFGRMLVVLLVYGALLGAFRPGLLEATLWFHLEVVAQLAVLLLLLPFSSRFIGFVGKSIYASLMLLANAIFAGISWGMCIWMFSIAGAQADDSLFVLTRSTILQGVESLGSNLVQMWAALMPGVPWVAASSMLIFLAGGVVLLRERRRLRQFMLTSERADGAVDSGDAAEMTELAALSSELTTFNLLHGFMMLLFAIIVVPLMPMASWFIPREVLDDASPLLDLAALLSVRVGFEYLLFHAVQPRVPVQPQSAPPGVVEAPEFDRVELTESVDRTGWW